MSNYQQILACFREIYESELSEAYVHRLNKILNGFKPLQNDLPSLELTERDSILITYGDAIQSIKSTPLKTLGEFLRNEVGDAISTVHLLPFFPYSSDDGFSVIDFYQVDPEIGSWEDVIDLGESYDLMFDAVINHISVRSEWFERFLRDEQSYQDFFITVDEGVDLSKVFRPRALPLLTEFQTADGSKKVWTTFSIDQVDLNYRHPEVLLEITRILLMFVERGARFIRLDAIAYIWKELGTNCLHHQKVHRIIQFFRLIFEELAPYVQVITETNVPHEENISYFGDGTNEAQLVYNFSLPPLVLHAFHQQNALILSQWAKTLVLPSKQTSFFNFLASHDGIGVTPAKGLIPEEEIEQLCERVKRLGGFVSYKGNPDGTRSPYELNINYLDALGDPAKEDEPIPLVSDRFLASQSIMLALKGVPGIYYHSLMGSRSWNEGVRQTGRKRTINREKLDIDSLLEALHEKGSLRQLVFNGLMSMLRSRAFNAEGAFSPYGEQSILDVNDKLMAILRSAPNQTSRVLYLCNVSAENIELIPQDQPLGDLNWQNQKVIYARNASLLSGRAQEKVLIGPYGILWILFRRGN